MIPFCNCWVIFYLFFLKNYIFILILFIIILYFYQLISFKFKCLINQMYYSINIYSLVKYQIYASFKD